MKYDDILALKIEILSEGADSDLEERIVSIVSSKENMSTHEKMECIEKLKNEIVGYGAIQPLLDDPDISEIMINGLEENYIERKGELSQIPRVFDSEDHIMQLVYRIAAEVEREVNQANPLLDARLRDGSRVNIILPPLSLVGPVVTIRKFNKQLLSSGNIDMFTPDIEKFIANLVRAKYNIFICGGTGTGKTTLLNHISKNIPAGERVITVEDAAEIDISDQGHVITLETKSSTNKAHDIGISRLIRNALRMRPDRIIVGEVRGEEVVDMLQAMNTGHDGSISTGHANSAMDMLIRLEVISSGHSQLNHELIKKQIISAIDIIIHIERHRGRRAIENIFEIEKNTGDYKIHKIYEREEDEETTEESFEKRLINNRKFRRYIG